MSMNITRAQVALLLAALLAVVLAAGCAKEPRTAVGRLDTPSHHTLRGHDFIERGQWEDAAASFEQALSLDADYAPAIAGKAIVTAHRAGETGRSRREAEALADEAEGLISRALSEADDDEQERTVHVAGIRVYRLAKIPEDWLEEAEDHYEEALDLDERGDDPQPRFYMARAYRDAFDMRRAQDLYRDVLAMDTAMTGQADRELAIVQKIIRAEPGSRHGRAVAFEPSISRADVAALFIEELRLDKLYERGGQQFDTRFRPPAQSQTQLQADRVERMPEAVDIEGHPLAADIREILALHVAGLEPDPSHKFHPNEEINRAEFAMMVEDILVKVTGEQDLKTRFIGQASPFPDVRSDVPYFNAVQTVTSRNLMEPEDKVNGIFGPLEPVSGADALLVIRLLKDELRSYLRS